MLAPAAPFGPGVAMGRDGMPQSFLFGFHFVIALLLGAAIGQQCLGDSGLFIGAASGAGIAALVAYVISRCRRCFASNRFDVDRHHLATAAIDVAKLPLRTASVDDVAFVSTTVGSDPGSSFGNMANDVEGGSVVSMVSMGQSCAVCLEAFTEGDQQRTLPCFHVFHAMCVDNWLKSSTFCPTCRHDVLINDVTENHNR